MTDELSRFIGQRQEEYKRAFGLSRVAVVQQEDGHFAFEFSLKKPFEGHESSRHPGWEPYDYVAEDPAALSMIQEYSEVFGPLDLTATVNRGNTFATAAHTIQRKGSAVRPNDRCPCGSGKKFKRCCGG